MIRQNQDGEIEGDPLLKGAAGAAANGEESRESTLSLGDIYFVLFRHKWKILFFILLGFAGAVAVCVKRPPIYQSEAKILIRYLVERRPASPVGPNAQITSQDVRGDDILNSEVEILSSSDLAEQVADAIGPERILARLGGGNGRDQAAVVVKLNLKAEVPRNSRIIRLLFRHPDAELVQPVLSQVMSNYFKRHIEMHGGTGPVDEALKQQAVQLRSQLEDTEAELRRIKSSAGIISVEETKKADSERLLKLRIALDETEANLAGRKAVLQRLQAAASSGTNQNDAPQFVPPEKVNEYKSILAQLTSARQEEVGLLGKFAEGSRFVQGVRERISKLEKRKDDLEQEIPQLIAAVPAVGDSKAGPNPASEIIQIAALQGTLDVLKYQFEALSRESTNFDVIEARVSRLQRERELLATNYYFLTATIQQARLDAEIGPGRISNISIVQTPSPPSKDYSKTIKPAGLVLAGGMIAGLLLAFFIELVLDRRIKRPGDVVKTLGLPLFVSIPVIRLRGGLQFQASDARGSQASPGLLGNESAQRRRSGTSSGKELPDRLSPEVSEGSSVRRGSGAVPTANGDEIARESASRKSESALGILFKRKSSDAMATAKAAPAANAATEAVPAARDRAATPGIVWHANSPLEPYSEVLRSRIVTHFEDINLTRKPKLVGITSCNGGSGVSSVAASLAASLSQIGEGKVLLVDLNLERGAAHPFYAGKPVIGVSEALDRPPGGKEPDDSNLVLATANDSGDSPLRSLPSTLPRQFAGLVPRLKTSGYDYIIFDLPPVDQTSITPRVSGFMDLTLLVLESERTGSDVAKQVTSLLAELKANVACVLNKTRKHVPAWLQEEL